jgi:RimJ/RimL family protein N-acetyltransferase
MGSSGPIRLRDAEPSDAATIAQINADGWRAAYRGIVHDERLGSLPVDEWEREIASNLAGLSADSFSLVAELEGKLAGSCFVVAPGRDDDLGDEVAELVAIYVRPARWRRGVGGELMRAAEERVAERGYREISLWTFSENERALAFYEALGWARDGTEQLHPIAGVPAVRLRKRTQSPE